MRTGGAIVRHRVLNKSEAPGWRPTSSGFWCIRGHSRRPNAAWESSASCKRPIPKYSLIPLPTRSAGPERELPLVNAMRQLESSNLDRRVCERLEPGQGRASSLDRAMVLLNDVVEILTGAHLHVAPLRVLPSQQPQRSMTRNMTVQPHLARPSRQIRRKRLTKERLRRSNTTVTAKQKIDRLSLFIHSPIQVVPFSSNGDVCLVDLPGGADASSCGIGQHAERTP